MTQTSPHAPSTNTVPCVVNVHTVAVAAAESTGTTLACPAAAATAADLLSSAVRAGAESALYAADLGQVARQLRQFRSLLPRVTPYYAVKCNPDPVLLRFLALLGASFDCASSHEIALVSAALAPSAVPARIVFANPFKAVADLAHARHLGVRLMTFDCVDELAKIAEHFPAARLLLRLAVEDSHAKCPLSSKFGARLDELDAIFAAVSRLRLDLVGVAFHVGSGCTSVAAYVEALKSARLSFDRAKAAGLPALSVLDIGGGFPGYDGEAPITFRQITDVVRPCIESLFDEDVRVIAEPGRFFAAAAYTFATEVVLATEHGGQRGYYLGDGVFGSFRDAWLLNLRYIPDLLLLLGSDRDRGVLQNCNLYGPTREPVDVIARDVKLPCLRAGDWLQFPNMGAYTMSLCTKRCGVERYTTIYFYRMLEEDEDTDDAVVSSDMAVSKQIHVIT